MDELDYKQAAANYINQYIQTIYTSLQKYGLPVTGYQFADLDMDGSIFIDERVHIQVSGDGLSLVQIAGEYFSWSETHAGLFSLIQAWIIVRDAGPAENELVCLKCGRKYVAGTEHGCRTKEETSV